MDSKNSLAQNKLELVLDSSYLPRIIKPRKRRKRERNTRNATTTDETFLSDTFTFTINNKNALNSSINDCNEPNMKKIAENELFFLNSLKEAPLSIVSISEQIFLTQLNSSITSCSCHLCQPNQKIWAFSKSNYCDDFNYEKIQCVNNDLIKKNFGPIGSDRNKMNQHL